MSRLLHSTVLLLHTSHRSRVGCHCTGSTSYRRHPTSSSRVGYRTSHVSTRHHLAHRLLLLLVLLGRCTVSVSSVGSVGVRCRCPGSCSSCSGGVVLTGVSVTVIHHSTVHPLVGACLLL